MSNSSNHRRGGFALPLLLGLSCLPFVAGADSGSLEYRAIENATARPLQPVGPTTREELEAFVDGFMAVQMSKGPIAGASVAVVKDGALFFAKGYGYEDVEKKGHIVATVSGVSFDDYIDQNILKPLGMSRSTFREPLPAELAQRMSGGYTVAQGQFERRGFEFIHAAGPAGSMSATATDMARFMLAYLQEGALGDARILKPETVRLMHARSMSPDPTVNGSGLGFYETWIAGRRIVGHGGDTLYFHSVLTLLPEFGVGLFATINTGGEGAGASVELERAFVEHYFPAELPQVKPRADAVERNQRYAGSYRTLRHSSTQFEKIFGGLNDAQVVGMCTWR